MDFRALLFGSVLRSAITVILGLGIVVGGAVVTGVVGAPSVVAVDNSFAGVNETTTTINTDLVVNNPNPIGLNLGNVSINYAVSMNDVALAHGQKHGLNVSTGNSTVELTTRLKNEKIPAWWISHIRNNERSTVHIKADVHSGTVNRTKTFTHEPAPVTTDIISQFNSTETRPVNASSPLVSDPVLYINRTTATWGQATTEETPIKMTFIVYNPKSSPVTMTEIGYNITMNDVHMGEGTSENTVVIPPKSTSEIQTTTTIRNQHLDEWWVTHLERNQTTDLRISFDAKVQPPGTTQALRVPLREMTYTRTIETDIFGNKAPRNTTGSNGDETTTTTTTTERSETTTPTTTESGETTTTESEETTTTTTTTEDGGILGVVAQLLP